MFKDLNFKLILTLSSKYFMNWVKEKAIQKIIHLKVCNEFSISALSRNGYHCFKNVYIHIAFVWNFDFHRIFSFLKLSHFHSHSLNKTSKLILISLMFPCGWHKIYLRLVYQFSSKFIKFHPKMYGYWMGQVQNKCYIKCNSICIVDFQMVL